MLRLLRPIAATTGACRLPANTNAFRQSHSKRAGSVALVAAGAATRGRLWDWVPASLDRLELAERRILSRALPVPFEMTKVARLGTVVVPCSDAARAPQAPNLVMIHGFAGGNAVWAMVGRRLHGSCRQYHNNAAC